MIIVGDEGMPFHQCDVCNGILGLGDEVVGQRPNGTNKFMHTRCARPRDNAIPIEVWLDKVALQAEKQIE